MRLTLDAAPGEVREKLPELVRRLCDLAEADGPAHDDAPLLKSSRAEIRSRFRLGAAAAMFDAAMAKLDARIPSARAELAAALHGGGRGSTP